MLFTGTCSKKTQNILIKNLEVDPVIVEVNPDRPNIMYKKIFRQASTKTFEDLDHIAENLCKELQEKRLNFPMTILYTDLDCIEYLYEYFEYKMGELQYEEKPVPG